MQQRKHLARIEQMTLVKSSFYPLLLFHVFFGKHLTH